MGTVPIYVLAGQSNASLAGMDRMIDSFIRSSGAAAEFVKVAVNGTSLLATPRGPDWDPDSNELFLDLVNAILGAMANALAQGHSPDVHILWVQGEGYRGARPDPYADKLTQFINELRAEIGAADAPFTISLIPHDNTTRIAQLQVAEAVENVLVIDPVNPGFYDEDIHYDRPTREAIATAWLETVAVPTVIDPAYVRLIPYSGVVADGPRDIVTGLAYQDFVYTSGDRIQWVTSFSGDDIIRTGASNDRIDAGGNDDTVYAGAGDDYVDGDVHEDSLYGEAGRDVLLGGSGDDYVDGGDGNDALRGNRQNDVLMGGAGDDSLQGDQGDDLLNGGAGSDTATYSAAEAGVTVTLTTDTAQNTGGAGVDTLISIENVTGSEFADALTGSAALNRIIGRQGADRLVGLAGEDRMDGAGGDDVIIGGGGRDILYGGGGADRFVYDDGHFGGLTPNTAEQIRDFSHAAGDIIDLRPVDGNRTTAADDGFTFIGLAVFSGTAGQLRYELVGNLAMIYADTNGDSIADFAIRLENVSALTAQDFAL